MRIATLLLFVGVCDALVEDRAAHREGNAKGATRLRKSKSPEKSFFGNLVEASPSIIALDDAEPVAPFDRVSPSGVEEPTQVAPAGRPTAASTGGGNRRPAIFVPPYLYPDAYPKAASDVCNCKVPEEKPLTPEEQSWAEEVAASMGLPLSQVLGPRETIGVTTCDCGSASSSKGQVWRWVKRTPWANGTGFTLESRDPTFPNGDYWEPEFFGINDGGLIAPLDASGSTDLPEQAPFDRVDPVVGAVSSADKLPPRFSRFLDQLEARKAECDHFSERCTSACKKGDEVLYTLGNTQINATIIETSAGNLAQIEYETATGKKTLAETTACPLQALCSPFRPCVAFDAAGAPTRCEQVQVEIKPLWNDGYLSLASCSNTTTVCKTIQQQVQATYLRKDGKVCRAV